VDEELGRRLWMRDWGEGCGVGSGEKVVDEGGGIRMWVREWGQGCG